MFFDFHEARPRKFIRSWGMHNLSSFNSHTHTHTRSRLASRGAFRVSQDEHLTQPDEGCYREMNQHLELEMLVISQCSNAILPSSVAMLFMFHIDLLGLACEPGTPCRLRINWNAGESKPPGPMFLFLVLVQSFSFWRHKPTARRSESLTRKGVGNFLNL